MVTKKSAAQTVNVNPNNLDSSITITVSGDFEVSSDNINFSNSISINGSSSSNIFVRFSPSELGNLNGSILFESPGAGNANVSLAGTASQFRYNYRAFSNQRIAWGGGHGQSSVQSFDLHNDTSDIEIIKMYLRLDCPSGGCDPWDRYANIMVRDKITNEWFEIGRHITPYGVDNNKLTRGLEFDVTDFKDLLEGNVELRIFVETWVGSGWIVSLEFDFIPGTPDYKYYKVSRIIQHNGNSLGGVPYGGLNGNTEIDLDKFDLIKSLQIGNNVESAHIRTIVTGWGHATPADSDGRACAEWCFRTHNIKIDNSNLFSHYMGPIGCSQNPINNQGGNWQPDRAGWCPGMTVPVRIDKFSNNVSNKTLNYEYDFENWTNDFVGTTGYNNKNAFYAISSFLILKSNSEIERAIISN
ncbi:MAG: peptidase [Cryomorphaceae bacterium]|nr:MAG: peptidase [Cryomorphaceae bacterium]